MAPFATTSLKWWAQPRILLGTCLLLLSPESENKLDTHLFFTTLGKVVVVLTAILVALIVNELSESKVRPLKSGGFARNVSDGNTAKRRPKKTQRTKPKKKRTSKKRKKINRRERNTASTTLTRAYPPKQPAVPNEAVYQVMSRACYKIFDRFETSVQRQRDNIQRLYYAVFRRAGDQSEEQRRQECLERSGVLTRIPMRPDMAAAATRLRTFRNWPHPQSLPPERMAGAGFYYTGEGDLVKCFYCYQDLEKWETADDPWKEHCRHYPNCPYVQYVNAYLPADSLTMSEEDIRRLMESQQRTGQPARVRNDDTSELRSRCWRCNSNDRQVVFPCGHKNVCWKCYQCPSFLESFQPLPTCCDCQRPFGAEVFQDKIIQISVRRFNQMRRVRSGYQRGR